MAPRRPGLLLRLSTFLENVAIACLLVMALFIIIAVFARNFMNLGLPWAEEIARFCNVALVFLAAPLLLVTRIHISVDFFVLMLPNRWQRRAERLALVVVAAFTAVFLFAGWVFIGGAWKFATPSLGIPNWLFYLPVFLGVALMGVVALRAIFDPSSLAREPAAEPDAP